MVYPAILLAILLSQVSYIVLAVNGSAIKEVRQSHKSHLLINNTASVILADDTVAPHNSVPSDQSSSNIPSNTTTTSPDSTVPADNSASQNQPPPESSNSNSENVISPNTDNNKSTESPTHAPPSTDETGNELNQESASSNTEILTSTDVLTQPETINQEIVQKSALEEDMLAQASTKEQVGNILVQLANEKIDDINDSLSTKDFATVNYINQRLDNQIDAFTHNLQNLTLPQEQQLEQKFKIFSANAETELRSEQLVVPEGLEQDLEITRGKILSIDNLP